MNLNNKKILFLLFSPLFAKGGHSKNFINLIKYIEPEIKRYQYAANIISYNNNTQEKAENINKISGIPFFISYKVKIMKRIFPSGKAIFQLSEFVSNLIRTFIFVLMNKPSIVYAYSNKPLYIISPLKKIFKFKLIYDMRGDVINEKKVQGASKKYISRLSKTHKRAVDSADLVFSVSETYDAGLKEKPFHKFNYYDGEIFRYDESLMLKKKEELKLVNKFIFVYTGNAHYYQFLDGTLNFFSQFIKKHCCVRS